MTMEVDLFWSFRSPYSYLGTPRYREMEREHDLKINVRPVYPIAIRTPEFFSDVNPLWPRYLMRDVFRVADYLELPFSWPEPDPVVMDMPTRTIPKEQPYIHRLTRLGIEAVNRGAGLAFISEVSDLLWGRAVKQWHEGDHLAEATARAGLDLAQLDATAEREANRLDAAVAQNQQDLEAAGHWGVPTMVFEGEPFFGQDRIDLLAWRLKRRGLRSR